MKCEINNLDKNLSIKQKIFIYDKNYILGKMEIECYFCLKCDTVMMLMNSKSLNQHFKTCKIYLF